MKAGACFFRRDASGRVPTFSSLQAGDAWYSVSGGTAQQLLTMSELRTDVLWISNLSQHEIDLLQLDTVRLRPSTWLRTSIQQLVGEIGAGDLADECSTATAAMSRIAQHVADATEHYGVTPVSSMLAQDFAKAFPGPRLDIADDVGMVIDSIAGHVAVAVKREPCIDPVHGTVLLRSNRLDYAAHLLNQLVPQWGQWEPAFTLTGATAETWLEGLAVPFMVRCSVSSAQRSVAQLLPWICGADPQREWVTDIEWFELRKHATVRVHEVMTYDREPLPLAHKNHLPKGVFAALSITNCLMAEQLVGGVLLKQLSPQGRCGFTTQAAWLRAVDRIEMFKVALELSKEDISVARYGNGNILAEYRSSGLGRLIDVASDLGLMPPASKFREAVEGRGGE